LSYVRVKYKYVVSAEVHRRRSYDASAHRHCPAIVKAQARIMTCLTYAAAALACTPVSSRRASPHHPVSMNSSSHSPQAYGISANDVTSVLCATRPTVQLMDSKRRGVPFYCRHSDASASQPTPPQVFDALAIRAMLRHSPHAARSFVMHQTAVPEGTSCPTHQ